MSLADGCDSVAGVSDEPIPPAPIPAGDSHVTGGVTGQVTGEATGEATGAVTAAAPPEAGAAPLDLERIERDLAGVETALRRLDEGTYWTDEVTGEPIPDDVLTADPVARRAG